MKTLEDILAEQMKGPDETLEPEFSIIQAMIHARKNSVLTQKQLSQKTGIAQADINKPTNGNANPSLRTLQRLTTAVNMKLKIEFQPIREYS